MLVDASVILAAADRDDPHHGAAAALLSDPHVTLATIDLVRYEVANVAIRAWHAPAVVEPLLDAVERIAEDGGVVPATGGLVAAAARLAEAHTISVYDAAYVEAARRVGRPLVSCDLRDLVDKGLAVAPGSVGA